MAEQCSRDCGRELGNRNKTGVCMHCMGEGDRCVTDGRSGRFAGGASVDAGHIERVRERLAELKLQSSCQVARILNSEKIKTPSGITPWSPQLVCRYRKLLKK